MKRGHFCVAENGDIPTLRCHGVCRRLTRTAGRTTVIADLQKRKCSMKKVCCYSAVALTVLLSGCIVVPHRQQVIVPPQVQPGPPLGIEDIKALAKAGLSDDLIVSQIRNSGTVYHLNAADIILLKNAGVSEKVIDCMINTPNAVMPPPTASVQQTVVVDPVPTCVVAPVVYPYGGWGWYGGYWGPRHYWR